MALNGIGQAATPPLIDFHDLTAIGCDDLFDTILNGAYLFFVDFGIENERKFVVSSHEATSFLWVYFWSDGFFASSIAARVVEHQRDIDADNRCRSIFRGLN